MLLQALMLWFLNFTAVSVFMAVCGVIVIAISTFYFSSKKWSDGDLNRKRQMQLRIVSVLSIILIMIAMVPVGTVVTRKPIVINSIFDLGNVILTSDTGWFNKKKVTFATICRNFLRRGFAQDLSETDQWSTYYSELLSVNEKIRQDDAYETVTSIVKALYDENDDRQRDRAFKKIIHYIGVSAINVKYTSPDTKETKIIPFFEALIKHQYEVRAFFKTATTPPSESISKLCKDVLHASILNDFDRSDLTQWLVDGGRGVNLAATLQNLMQSIKKLSKSNSNANANVNVND